MIHEQLQYAEVAAKTLKHCQIKSRDPGVNAESASRFKVDSSNNQEVNLRLLDQFHLLLQEHHQKNKNEIKTQKQSKQRLSGINRDVLSFVVRTRAAACFSPRAWQTGRDVNAVGAFDLRASPECRYQRGSSLSQLFGVSRRVCLDFAANGPTNHPPPLFFLKKINKPNYFFLDPSQNSWTKQKRR